VRIGDNTTPKGNVQIGNKAKINGTLYYANNIHIAPSGFVQNSVHGPADLPSAGIPTQWPAPGPSVMCPQGGEQFPARTTDFQLQAGHHYSSIHAGKSKITFHGAGDYFIDSIDIGSVKLTYDFSNTDHIRVFVCEGVHGSTITSPAPSMNANHIYWEVNGTPPGTGATGNIFEFSGGPWVGDVVAPHGGIHYGSGGAQGSMSGHFWAEHIDLEHGLHVSSPAPEPPAATTTTSTIHT